MVKLSDGKEYTADLYKLTTREWYELRGMTDQEGDEIIARVYGLTAAEMDALPYPDHWALVQDFFAASRDPLAGPKN